MVTDAELAVEEFGGRPEEDRLYRMRHSAAHIMAQAVLEMMPEAKLAIGPPIETGFYYDFLLPRPLSSDDLPALEARMREVVAANVPFEESRVPKEEARQTFADQPFKLELIESFDGDDVGLCRHDTFLDLCRGRHVERSGEVGAFKLMNVAGAYWRGDEKRPMLTRIYGALFATPDELEAYERHLEEARARDHRRLGRELGLFYLVDDIGPGLPVFTPKGEMVRHLMESFVRETQTKHGYQHVWTGNVVRESLFKKSGHYDNYDDVMFPPMVDGDDVFRLKPMNCPSHMTLYKEMGVHSYRELPLRFCEFATLYRYEASGAIGGLTRVRSLTQDDCHVFCTPDQIEEEFTRCLQLVREVLSAYGMTEYRMQLSLKGGEGKYVQDEEKWDTATRALTSALDANGVQYEAVEGEAAFYGPKADLMTKDALGREWQLSTIQIDFIQPARLGVEYIGEDGHAHTPVLIHRAVMGATERFLGVLIEHFAGAFPLWLAPVQAVVIPIADRHNEYASEVQRALLAAGLRVEVDHRTERMNAKIRDAQLQKVPYMLVVGDREAEAGMASVRLRSGEDLKGMALSEIVARMQDEVA
ncbi:MAG: threonine--tRNA ligase, partial [Dehalococcoidia bacterium]